MQVSLESKKIKMRDNKLKTTKNKKIKNSANEKVQAFFKIASIVGPILETKEKNLKIKVEKNYARKETCAWH